MAKINVNYIVYTDKNHKKQVLSLIFFFNLILIVKKNLDSNNFFLFFFKPSIENFKKIATFPIPYQGEILNSY